MYYYVCTLQKRLPEHTRSVLFCLQGCLYVIVIFIIIVIIIVIQFIFLNNILDYELELLV